MVSKSPGKWLVGGLAIAVVLWVLGDLGAAFWVDRLWFMELGYGDSFYRRLAVQLGLGGLAGGLSFVFCWVNLNRAQRYQWSAQELQDSQRRSPTAGELNPPSGWALGRDFRQGLAMNPPTPAPRTRPKISTRLGLVPLLVLIGAFTLLIGLLLFYYLDTALQVGQQNYNVQTLVPPLPSPLGWALGKKILAQLYGQLWKLGVVAGLLVGILTRPLWVLRAIALGFSAMAAWVLSGNWIRFLQLLQPTAFGDRDPLFHHDLSFYIFDLPWLQVMDFWLGGLFLYSLVAVTLVYLLSGGSVSQGFFPGFSPKQLAHLKLLMGLFFFSLAGRHFLNRWELLYSREGVVYGAGYTDVMFQQYGELGLGIFAVMTAIALVTMGFFPEVRPKFYFKKFLTTSYGLVAVYLLLLLLGFVGKWAVQYVLVQPNELARETPYIEHNIQLTNQAFGLNNIESRIFDPKQNLTAEAIARNNLTIDNIRLWDTNPILKSNRQLQQIRLYYSFFDADIDRYTLPILTPPSDLESDRTDKQQVIISPRELDYDAVPDQADTWINEHLVYTHGYGFTLSPVNQVAAAGLPKYFVKDIGSEAGQGGLTTISPALEKYIAVDNPRIYYGELTDNYIMTPTQVEEFDFPQGEVNVYNRYQGQGGIPLKSWGRKVIFGKYLRDWRMLLANNFQPDTKILLRRNINTRVKRLAPFLRFDRDPYLVVIKDPESGSQEDHLYWILDAYTTSSHYPYSDPGPYPFNYIRNSVKAVVNAYDGDVQFFISDPSDPIIRTWAKVFPGLFQDLEAMAPKLRQHLRYPADFFAVQSQQLLTYHMKEPQVFYNREDQWEIPEEIYAGESQAIAPYYLIMKLPMEQEEEFILLHLYTPKSRPNLVAWLAARSDGEQYGKLLLYQFSKQELIYGTNQVEALINQDPVISQQISLWNNLGSRVLQGNLLVIPIEDSLLYVEPLYLEAEENSVPSLARVIVVYNNRIVMAETLDQGLEAIFQPDRPGNDNNAPIVRPVDESLPVLPLNP